MASLVAVALAVPTAAADVTPQDAAVNLTLREDGTATATVVQTWEGAGGRQFRYSLDQLFGNRDGTLSRAELDTIANLTGKSLDGRRFPLVTLDGRSASVDRASFAFEDAAKGSTTSEAKFRTTHTLSLRIEPSENATHALTLRPNASGWLIAEAPEGWTFRDPENLWDSILDGSRAEGWMDAGTIVTIALVAPRDAPPAPPAGKEEEAREAPVPALAALAALGLAGALAARRRRRS